MLRTDCLLTITAERNRLSLLLLSLRFVVGILLIFHGWNKLTDYHLLCDTFPDPLGIGSNYSLILAIFGELFCSLFFLVGYQFRIATLPMLITLSVAFFYVHGGHVSEGELAFVYMMLLLFLLVMGAGRFSLDHYLFKRRYREHPTLHE